MVENLNDVVQAMDDAKPARKKAPAKKSEETTAAPIITDDITPTECVEPNMVEPETPSFPGCNTCRNFGNYPSWQPCCDCKHNPKNSNSFYQA